MKDLAKIKDVLVRRVPEEETVMLYEQKKFDRPKEFQDFCQKLKDDPDFKSLYVSKLYKNFFCYVPIRKWRYCFCFIRPPQLHLILLTAGYFFLHLHCILGIYLVPVSD